MIKVPIPLIEKFESGEVNSYTFRKSWREGRANRTMEKTLIVDHIKRDGVFRVKASFRGISIFYRADSISLQNIRVVVKGGMMFIMDGSWILSETASENLYGCYEEWVFNFFEEELKIFGELG
jgi:hypothetical protein